MDQDTKRSKGLVARDRFIAAGRRISMMNAGKRGSVNIADVAAAAAAEYRKTQSMAALAAQEAAKQQRMNVVSGVSTSIGTSKEVSI